MYICEREIDFDAGDDHSRILDHVGPPCALLLQTLHLRTSGPPVPLTSVRSLLGLCRTLSLIADLGLVAYVGSHSSRFDLTYLHEEISNVIFEDSDPSALNFDCRLRRLACLNSFLDEEKVWVFRCRIGGMNDLPQGNDPRADLPILTHMEEFADIWGPVWSIPADQNSSELIRRYNVSKGVICRVDEAESPKGSPIRCHWYDWTSYRRRGTSSILSAYKPLYLHKEELLLIGTRFREKQDCKYTLDRFEEDYGHAMCVLGGERSMWEPDLDSRSGGFSVSKIVGITVTGTQKRRPQTSLKQLILAKWKSAPQTANPGILNQYLGVEVSHCTGNARRVCIKDLLLMSTVRPLLDLHFPKWSSSSWGFAFLQALRSDEPHAVYDVWVKYKAKRSNMAAIVCYVLELLDKTGRRGNGLKAAFLNNRQELSIDLDHNGNDWSSLLQDSHLMATYVIVNNICIECHTPDHSTATCGGYSAYTVLGTRVGLNVKEVPDLVRMQPHGQIWRILNRIDMKTLLMVSRSSASTAGAYILSYLPSKPVASGIEIRDVTAKGWIQYQTYLRSSNTSLGGMRAPRSRSQIKEDGTAQWVGRSSRGASPNIWYPWRPINVGRPTERGEAWPGSFPRRRALDSDYSPQVPPSIDLTRDSTLHEGCPQSRWSQRKASDTFITSPYAVTNEQQCTH